VKRAWLRFIAATLNKATVRRAYWRRGPFAAIRVAGRTSGIVRETPIIAAPIAGGFMIELTYGPEVQWYRNVVAAGGCVLVHHAVEHTITRLEPGVPVAEGRAAFGSFPRVVLRLLRRTHFVRFLEG
jgi:hypothetical protein